MRFIKKITLVGSGSALAQLVTALGTPVLTRLYAPEAYAEWAIFSSITAVFAGVATMRYELAMVLPREKDVVAAIAVGGTCIAFLISACAGAMVWAAGGWSSHDGALAGAASWWFLVPPAILSAAIFQMALAWCTHAASFKVYAAVQFLLSAAVMSGQVVGALAGWRHSGGLIVGSVAGQVLGASVLATWIILRDRKDFSRASVPSRIHHALAQYKQYPMYMAPYTLLGVLRERLVFFLLGRFGTQDAVGFYGAASRLANLPNSVVSRTIRPVFFHHASGAELRSLEQPILVAVRTLGIAGVLMLAPCAAQASWLTALVLGPMWGEAAPYVVVVSIPMIPLLMCDWLDRMFDVLGRQRMALTLEAVFSAIAMAGLVLGYVAFRDMFLAVCVQSGLLAIYYMCWLAVLFRTARFRVSGLLRAFAEVALVGAVAVAVCMATGALASSAIAFPITMFVAGMAAAWYGYGAWAAIRRVQSGGWNGPSVH